MKPTYSNSLYFFGAVEYSVCTQVQASGWYRFLKSDIIALLLFSPEMHIQEKHLHFCSGENHTETWDII